MFSSSVRAAMKAAIGASHSSAWRTRSLFVRKRGSAIMSSRPIGAEQPLRHRLDRGRDADIAPVLGAEHVARAGRLGAAAGARPDLAGQSVDRRLGRDEREDRVEQRQIDDLARAALDLDPAQRHHDREGAVQPGDHVGQRGRRQYRLAVGKAGARGIARHALDQRAEAGPVAIGPALPPARDAHDHETRIAGVQHVRAEPHFFERAGTEILDQHLARRGEIEQQIAAARLAQAQRDALLVARIELPVDADPAALPGAQRIALYRVLDLDDLRPEIGELRGHRVAGDEPRQIDDPDAVERTVGGGIERFFVEAHRQRSSRR